MFERTADASPVATFAAPSREVADLMPLEVAGLTLEVGGKRLVDDVDLVMSGLAMTIVMGPNGAGKSLLLRLLHGLIAPTSGIIRWGGAPMSDVLRKQQAMVFQHAVLLRRSVAANVEFALRLSGPVQSDRRDELLGLVGLLDRSRQPARLLSGGEQQRLALARALATDPKVLFLDEPTASLDPASVLAIEEIVRKVRLSGTKIIFVTHDIGQARRLADDVAYLNQGQLVEHTPAERFFANPTSEAARAYLEGRILI